MFKVVKKEIEVAGKKISLETGKIEDKQMVQSSLSVEKR